MHKLFFLSAAPLFQEAFRLRLHLRQCPSSTRCHLKPGFGSKLLFFAAARAQILRPKLAFWVGSFLAAVAPGFISCDQTHVS